MKASLVIALLAAAASAQFQRNLFDGDDRFERFDNDGFDDDRFERFDDDGFGDFSDGDDDFEFRGFRGREIESFEGRDDDGRENWMRDQDGW